MALHRDIKALVGSSATARFQAINRDQHPLPCRPKAHYIAGTEFGLAEANLAEVDGHRVSLCA